MPILLLLLLAATAFCQPFRSGGFPGPNRATTDYYDLSAPYPVGAVGRYYDDVYDIYRGGTQLAMGKTIRTEPENGLNGGIVEELYLNLGRPSGANNAMTNRLLARMEIEGIRWGNGGSPDTFTVMFSGDTTLVKGYMPRDNLEGLYNWTVIEGGNAWVNVGSSSRNQKVYATTIFLNMEFEDSVWFWVRPYVGNPWVDTLWSDGTTDDNALAYHPGFYHGVSYTLVPNKSDLFGRRLWVQGRKAISRALDITCIGAVPANKSGFLRLISWGYGGAWDDRSTLPFGSSSPYPELNSVKPGFNSNVMLEEDVLLYRRYGPVITTLSSNASYNTTTITVNEPALGSWAAYLPNGYKQAYWENMIPVLVYNNYGDPRDININSWGKTAITDNGSTWTITVDGSSSYRNNTEYQTTLSNQTLRYPFDSGDRVVLYGNYIRRLTGSEDDRGGYYNDSAAFFDDAFGAPVVRAQHYAIDSINGATPIRGASFYRVFGPDINKAYPLNFQNERLWSYISKTRNTVISGSDSCFDLLWETQGSMVFYTLDLFAMDNTEKWYQESWTASAGDGVANRTGGSVAAWTTLVNQATSSNINYNEADGDVSWYLTDCLTDGNLKISRLFFPFSTAGYDDSAQGKLKVNRKLFLEFSVQAFDARVNQSNSFAYAPYWQDSTRFAVVTSTQASVSALVNTDWDEVGETPLNTIGFTDRMSCWTKSFSPMWHRVIIPIDATTLTESGTCKLALRFYDLDLLERAPGNVGGNRYILANSIAFSEIEGQPGGYGLGPRIRQFYQLQ